MPHESLIAKINELREKYRMAPPPQEAVNRLPVIQQLGVMGVVKLNDFVGRLSNPEKMPGWAWGIPAKRCHVGSKLREVKGSVCEKCYAMKGRFIHKPVEAAYERRYQKYLGMPGWIWFHAMCLLLQKRCSKIPYFRWFDSGDLQDYGMLWNIIDVCSALPKVHFWMATKERGLVKKFLRKGDKKVPNNLVIRVSGAMIDGKKPEGVPHTSGVLSVKSKTKWATMVESNTKETWHCPAPLNENECGTCRACWDPEVKHVLYRQH